MKVTLGIREIDLSKALPLKLRDWRILEKKGITAKTLENTSIEAVAELVFLVLNKADGTVTMEEVDDLEDDLEGIVTLGGVCAREEDARGEYARGEVVA